MVSDASYSDGPSERERTHTGAFVTIGVVLLLVVAIVALFLSNLLVWVDTSLLNSSEFSSSVNDALDEPEVKDRIAQGLSREIVNSGEIQARVAQELPPNLQFAGRAVDAQLETALTELIRRLLDTEFAGSLRRVAVERLHQAVINVLEDRDSAVQAQGDQIVLDLNEVAGRVFDRIGVSPPSQGGADSRDFGQIVLVEDAGGLREASFFVKNRTAIAVGCLVIAIVAFALAVLLSPNRRRAALHCGYAVAFVGLLTLLLVWASNQALSSAAEERVVVREIVRSLESNLRLQSLALILLGACVIAMADARILNGLSSAYRSSSAAVGERVSPTVLLVGIAAIALLLILI